MRLHSVVGLVTNSSSETFITIHGSSRQMFIDLFNDILRAGGSDKQAEELFSFEYIMDFTLANSQCLDVAEVNEYYKFDPPAETEDEARQMLFMYSLANGCEDVTVDGCEQFESMKPAVTLQIIPKDGVVFPEGNVYNRIMTMLYASEYDWN